MKQKQDREQLLKITFGTENQITILFRLRRSTGREAGSVPSAPVAGSHSNLQWECLDHRGNACGCAREAPSARRIEPEQQVEGVRVEGHFTMPDGVSQNFQLLPERSATHSVRLMTDQIYSLEQQIALMAHILAELRTGGHKGLFGADPVELS